MNEQIPFTRETFTRMDFGANIAFVKDFVLDPKFEFRHEFPNMVMAQWRGYLWGRELGTHEFRAPADWWEALKARWFPAWALKRWPVRERVERLDVKALYPSIRYVVDRHRPTLIMERFNQMSLLEPPTDGR